MDTRPLVPVIVENNGDQEQTATPAPRLRSVLKPSPPPQPLPPTRTMVQLPGEAVRGAVGVATTAASTAVSAAATTMGYLAKLQRTGEQPEEQQPSAEGSSQPAAGDHRGVDSESFSKMSSLTAREKHKWESLRAVGNPMMQTVCFVLSVLSTLLMVALLTYMLTYSRDKPKPAAVHAYRPTVTADPDDTTVRMPNLGLPAEYHGDDTTGNGTAEGTVYNRGNVI